MFYGYKTDDHDFGINDQGKEYGCKDLTQREFCIHFNISTADVRHPDHMPFEKKQSGIYSSLVLPPPPPYNVINSKEENDESVIEGGVHVINIDTRSQRSILKIRWGDCFMNGKKHSDSDYLDKKQWKWLSDQLFNIKSQIKIISTSVQALTPSDARGLKRLCSYDGTNSTFMNAIYDIGEDENWMEYQELYLEKWADVPIARKRLLTMAQASINRNMTQKVIFTSGNAHFSDILVKRMPDSKQWGPSQILYEVVSSGIGQSPRNDKFVNNARVRLRTCDTRGDGHYFKECKFPFIFEGKTYNDCIQRPSIDNAPWCYYQLGKKNPTKPNDKDAWGHCLPEEEELVPRSNQKVSSSYLQRECANNYHHICGMNNMYGGISIDWNNGTIDLSNYGFDAPTQKYNSNSISYEEAISAVTIHFNPQWKKKTNSSSGKSTLQPTKLPLRQPTEQPSQSSISNGTAT